MGMKSKTGVFAAVAIAALAAPVANAGTAGICDNRGVDVSMAEVKCAEIGEAVFSDGFADTSVWDRVAYSTDCMNFMSSRPGKPMGLTSLSN